MSLFFLPLRGIPRSATEWNRYFRSVDAVAFGTVVPTWEATSDPAIGNGSLAGHYAERGGWATLSVDLTTGSTTTYGSGGWEFAPPDAVARPAVGEWTGTVYANGGGVIQHGVALISDSTDYVRIYSQGGSQTWRSTVPVTWASGDMVSFSIRYRVAS